MCSDGWRGRGDGRVWQREWGKSERHGLYGRECTCRHDGGDEDIAGAVHLCKSYEYVRETAVELCSFSSLLNSCCRLTVDLLLLHVVRARVGCVLLRVLLLLYAHRRHCVASLKSVKQLAVSGKASTYQGLGLPEALQPALPPAWQAQHP